MPTDTPVQPRVLAIIRGALLAGVLLFGAACWLSVRQRGGGAQAGVSPDSLAMLRIFVPILCVIALGAAIGVRLALRRATFPPTLRIVAWAAGEAPALAGGVYYLMLGDPRLYVIGVTAMLATFIVVPVREVS